MTIPKDQLLQMMRGGVIKTQRYQDRLLKDTLKWEPLKRENQCYRIDHFLELNVTLMLITPPNWIYTSKIYFTKNYH